MNTKENRVTYSNSNSYNTLNTCSSKTKNVWIVFHGIGYLSRFFLKYFDELPADENFIIAPQAPSKYYLNNEYKHVGASWLTKEATAPETENLLNYLDAVFANETLPKDCQLIILGYSQGVSIAMRWVSRKQIKCDLLVLYAGGIPNELKHKDFEFLGRDAQIKLIVGDADQYLTPERLELENNKIKMLFPDKAELIRFAGKHEIKKSIINALV